MRKNVARRVGMILAGLTVFGWSASGLWAAQPDLIIADLTYPSATPGDAVQFTIKVTNQGAASAASNRLELWLDNALRATATVPALGPGQSATLTLPSQPWIATAGGHPFWVKTDVWLQVAESDESNNERSFTIQVGTLPDVVLTAITVPSTITAGDRVAFGFTVINQGAAAAPWNLLEVWLDGVKLGTYTVPALQPGQAVFISYPMWTATGGTHNLWAKADVWLVVDESNETNNERTATIMAAGAGQADLTLRVTPPTQLVQGTPAQFTITVRNTGTATAGSHRLELWLDGAQLSGETIPSLAAGQETTVSLPRTPWVPTAGMHQLWAKTDVWLQVPEFSELNNEVSLPQLEALAADKDLVVLGVTPIRPTRSPSYTFTAVVRNRGVQAAPSSRFELWVSGVLTDIATIPPLAGGASTTLTFTASHGYPSETTQSLWAKADVWLQVPESDDNNNVFTGSFYVYPFGPITP